MNNSIISGLTASLTLIPDSANPDTTQSTLTAAPPTIVANGLAKSLLTLTLKDGNGNPIDGQTVTFSSTLANTTLGSVTDNHDGTYSAELAGTTAGAAAVSARVNGQPFAVSPASVTLTADAPDAAQSTLTAAPTTIVANGVAKSLLTLTLKDGNGNLIDGQTVTFSSTLANTTLGSVTDNHDGTYSAELAGTTAGAAAVSARVNGQPFAVSPASVTLTADAPDAAQSTLTAAPPTIVANGVAKSLLTLTLKDGNGNPIDGQMVTFSSTLANTTFGSVTDNHDGTYSTELAGTTAGAAAVSARVNGQPFAVSPASVTLTADAPDAAQSTLTAAPPTIVANGVAKSLLTLTLKDGNGNPIDGQTVTFSSTLANTTLGSVTDNHDGTYSAELAGTTAGAAAVSAQLNGQPFAVSPASVTLTADAPDAAQSTLTAAPTTIVANGVAKSLLTLTLKDGNGNPIDGQTVTFSSTLANTTLGSVTDNHDGTYSAELAGTTAGAAAVSAQVNGQPFAVSPASVTLTADAPDAAQSTLTAAPPTIVANGVAKSLLTLTLKDGNGNPIDGQTVTFSSTLANTTFGSVTDNHDGTYSAELAGTTAGTASVSARVNGQPFAVSPASVTLTADAPDAAQSTLTAAPPTIVANGLAKSLLTLTLKDGNGNPIDGQTVTFSSSLANTTFGSVTDNHDGTYSAELAGTTAGAAAVSAQVNGQPFAVSPASVTLTADAPDAAQSTLTAAPTTIVANGVAKSLLTLTLKDGNGNLIDGQTVTFSSSLANTTFGSVTDHHDGTYSAELAGTTAGAAAVSAQVNGQPFAVSPASVTLTADAPDAAQSTLTAAPPTIVANGVAKSLLTLTLKDGNGNPIDGQTVTFSSTLANTTFGSVTDNHDGTYSAELAGTTAGAAAVSAQLNGQPFAVSPASVTLTADAPDAAQSTLTAAPTTIVANGLAKSLLTLTLKDGNGNPVDGQTVTFSSTLANTTFGSVTDNHDGTYSAELAGTTAGAAAVSAQVNGQPFAVSPASVTLTADAPDAAQSTLTAAPTTIVANGLAKSLLTLTLKDGNGNPVDGQTVTFSSTLANTTFGSVTDNHDGTYSAELAGTKVGTTSIGVQVGGVTFAVAPVTILLTPGPVSATSSLLSSSTNTILSDGTQTATLTYIARDTYGNAIDNLTLTSSVTGTIASDVALSGWTNTGDGLYTATISSHVAGSVSIAPMQNGTIVAQSPVDLAFVDISPNNYFKVSIERGPAAGIPANGPYPADGVTIVPFKIKVVNIDGNPVSGVAITLSTVAASQTIQIVNPSGITDANGVYDGAYATNLITSGVDLGKTYVSKMSVELVDHPMFNATVGILWRRVVP
ncbi:Ig-like domain-containing protein [Edwardsiella ictaluri]|uniref:beta strand repeat-containing protein n=1 Tax=Edwardsiella ictaluri TaxID=67780 RepID=UPI0037852C25